MGFFRSAMAKPRLFVHQKGVTCNYPDYLFQKNIPICYWAEPLLEWLFFTETIQINPGSLKDIFPTWMTSFGLFQKIKMEQYGQVHKAVRVYLLTPSFDRNGQPDINQFRFEKFGEAHGLKNSLGATYSIKGETWFVGDSALYKFDEKQKRFYPDTTTFGHFVNGGGASEFDMVEDSAGRVWLRFGKEAILATPQPNGKYRIDKTALLPIAERTFGKIYPEANGIVWICTTDGLVRYDENLEKNYAQSFNAVLRHITAGKNILNPEPGLLQKGQSSVSFKNNTLRFEYAAPFFEQEDKTQYQTWLEGFEKEWSGFDNNYYKEYTNLPAGKYHFHVRAKNVYQKLSEESVYSFTIMPPWYCNLVGLYYYMHWPHCHYLSLLFATAPGS